MVKLLKFLYGLKQYPHPENHMINIYFLFKKFKGVILINVFQENLGKLLFYYNFDDLLLTFNDLMFLKETKDNLLKFLEMV
jgi:hypothetical protein